MPRLGYLASTAKGDRHETETIDDLNSSRALGWLRETGLEGIKARTFVVDVHAPLSKDLRSALAMTFQMFWENLEANVRPEEWADFERFCQPGSPDFILNRPDYYAFLTYSLFWGIVAG